MSIILFFNVTLMMAMLSNSVHFLNICESLLIFFWCLPATNAHTSGTKPSEKKNVNWACYLS